MNGVEQFCICNSTMNGKFIICNNGSCNIAKYHMKCVSLKRAEKSWVGGNCIATQSILQLL